MIKPTWSRLFKINLIDSFLLVGGELSELNLKEITAFEVVRSIRIQAVFVDIWICSNKQASKAWELTELETFFQPEDHLTIKQNIDF